MKDRMRNQGRSAPDNKTYLIPSNLINLRAGKPNKNDIWIIISLFFLSPELLDRVRGLGKWAQLGHGELYKGLILNNRIQVDNNMKDRMRQQGRTAPTNMTYLIPSHLINLRAGRPNKWNTWIVLVLSLMCGIISGLIYDLMSCQARYSLRQLMPPLLQWCINKVPCVGHVPAFSNFFS